MKASICFTALVSAFALLDTAAAAPITEAAVKTFLASIKLNETAINKIKQTRGTQLACGVLEALKAQQLETKNDATYEKERTAHWSPTAWENPTCIYSPTSASDVSLAVKILAFTGSQYAIRSGGHSPLEGWASIDNGVLISMTKLKDISYDSAKQTVRFGLGNLWGDVYRYTEAQGRLPVGGRVGTVGPMLTPGGGLSHLSNRYGFSVDNVVSFEVVLADGSIVTASSSSKSDLFWALKGGSNNFGIITHMTLKTYPSGKVWGGLVIYNATLYQDQLMAAFATYQKDGQISNKDTAMLTYVGINNQTVFATYITYGATSRPAALQPFFDIPIVYDGTTTYDSFMALTEANVVDFVVPRWTYAMTNIYLDNATYVDVANACAEFAAQMSTINGGTYALMPQPISTSMIDVSKTTGGNALGLKSKPQLWFTVNIGWNFASDDAKAIAIATASMAKIEAITKSRGLYDPFIFLNDGGPNQKVIRSYGAENFAKMKKVSAAYDPRGMFQTQVPGGFKIV
ncbi:bifunctional solanapyrone synthase [Dendryphion nanum]|uniref:Bifunctional solanapyrone synthase n=1 Tax=Dendryphion nanum TaxID=256645 RepID=A0A9P9D9Y3_9PLEO|nr:bifunctional solanapyrone synthase [Dendryphion nanum]